MPEHVAAGHAEEAAMLLEQLTSLRADIVGEGEVRLAAWAPKIVRGAFHEGARNLAYYLALRHHDLRGLQIALMPFGLSSLGRLESRVLSNIDAVAAALAAIASAAPRAFPSPTEYFAGDRALEANVRELFGTPDRARRVRLLVTCPSEAASEPAFMRDCMEAGADAFRINCAHDDAGAWAAMLDHLHVAEAATGRRATVLMDLAGPKVRTGAARYPEGRKRVAAGDMLLITPPGGLLPPDTVPFQIECSLPEVLQRVAVGHRIAVDDGRFGGTIQHLDERGALLRIHHTPIDGGKLKAEKGLNFPDTDLGIDPLTDKDLHDLDFVAGHAGMIGYSFVQSEADVLRLQNELARRRPDDWQKLALVAKIETPRAVANLPGIITGAASKQPFAVMIARGDLAVEIGFERLAEMQEEIMWLCEAAQVPVIWATQVLESLVKKGLPSRGDMTDAAMSARSECVMLNKGPHLLEALRALDRLLVRMAEHQTKKTPMLRALTSW